MARGDCNITNICIPTRRIIYSAGFTPPAPPPPGCNFPEGSFAQGGEICDWEYRVRWDIDPTQVPSDQTNYLAYINLAELVSDLSPGDNALFWNDANRAEFRVTASDGATEIPHYTSALDTVSETGYIWALVPSVSSSVTTSLFIYLANPAATEYAVGDPLGRNATFTGAGMEAFWDFEQDPSGVSPQLTDLTGNGYNGAVSNETISSGVSGTVTKVAGKVGSAYLFGNRRYVNCGTFIINNSSITIGGWAKWGSTGGRGIFGASRATGDVNRFGIVHAGATNTAQMFSPGIVGGPTGVADSGQTLNDNAWHFFNGTCIPNTASTGVKIYTDGQLRAQASSANYNYGFATPPYLIAHLNNSSGVPVLANFDLEGEVSVNWFKLGTADSTDRVTTQHNNQNAPGTFATFTNFQDNGI